MASKMKGKGCTEHVEISSVYTAVPGLISIKISGEASETYPARTLDGTKHNENPNNGYVTSPKIDNEMFWDSNNTVHAFLKTSMRTPPAAGVNVKLTDTGATPVVEIWNCTGIAVDTNIVTDEGVKATVSFQTSGDPS